MFQWFLWDFDGTLFDTYPAANAALLESLAAWGIREDPEETMARLKVRQGPAIQYFQEKHRLPEGRLFEGFRRREAVLVPKCEPFPEAEALCREIVRRGGHNLLYTHRDRLALKMIEAAGLAPFFSGGVTGEDGFPSKPAPDAILHLLNTHAIPPGQALMIGDRLIDVQAAQNAGIAGCWWTEKADSPEYSGIRVRCLSQLEEWLPPAP